LSVLRGLNKDRLVSDISSGHTRLPESSKLATVLIIFVLLIIALFSGFVSSQLSPNIILWGGVALAVFALTFINTEFGLYVLIFSMLLSPEIIVGKTAGASIGRGVTLRLEDFLLVIIGFSWFAKNAVIKELGLFLKTPLNKAIFLYGLACALSTGFGVIVGRVDPKTGFFFVLKYFEYFIVFFMVVNHLKTAEQVRRFVFCLLLTCSIVSVIGIIQIPGGGRISAPFEGDRGEPNTFGGYLLFLGAIAAGMFSKAETTRSRNYLAALIVLIIPSFLFTLSRASYLAFIPTLVVIALLMEKKTIVLGIVTVLLILSPLFLPLKVKERILFTFSQPEHYKQITVGDVRIDTSTSARLVSWKEALQDWIRHPVLGYGVTGYKFVDAQLPRVLAETGAVGLIAFLYLLYAVGKAGFTALRDTRKPYFRGIAIGFLAGYTGLLFHSIGANTFIIVRIMEPFWFFTAIIVALPMIERSESSTVDANSSHLNASHLVRSS
jgi:O-antigen ligase